MDSIKASQELHDNILSVLRQAQRDANQEGRLTERAQWINAIKNAAPQSFRKILLYRNIVDESLPVDSEAESTQ